MTTEMAPLLEGPCLHVLSLFSLCCSDRSDWQGLDANELVKFIRHTRAANGKQNQRNQTGAYLGRRRLAVVRRQKVSRYCSMMCPSLAVGPLPHKIGDSNMSASSSYQLPAKRGQAMSSRMQKPNTSSQPSSKAIT